MRYKDPARVSFHERFTVITGPTGSGKTSLLDAVTFALYGKSSRTDVKVKTEDFLDKDGFVRLGFSKAGQDYEVTRGQRNGRNYLGMAQGSKKIPGSTTDLERKIENLVGLDYVGFRNSTFIRQDEMKQIGSESGAQRLEIFERLFRLEVFERAQEMADTKMHEADKKLSASTAELGMKQKEYSETLPSERKNLENVVRTFSDLEKDLSDLKGKAGNIDQLVRRLELSHKQYEAAARGVEGTGRDMTERKRELHVSEKRNRQRAELEAIVGKLRDIPKEKQKLEREKAELEQRHQKSTSVTERKRDRIRALDRIEKALAEEIREVQGGIRQDQERLKKFARALGKDQAFDLLREEGALTERIARIAKEKEWLKELLPPAFAETLSNEQREAQRKVARVTARTRKITGDIFVKSEIESSISRAKARLDRAETRANEQVEAEQAVIRRLDAQIKEVGLDPAAVERLRRVSKRLFEIAASVRGYDAAEKKLEKLPDQGPLIRSLKDQIKGLGDKLKVFAQQEKRLAEDEESYTQALKQQKSLAEEIGDIREKLGGTEAQKLALQKRVLELEGLKPVIEKLQETMRELGIRREVFTLLKNDVFHRKGILLFAINMLLQGIGREASLILGELTDQRLSNIRLTTDPEVRGGAVRIEVEGVDGLFRDVSGFSGGEKTQVNAALRFAISKELARMPQVGKSYGNMKSLFIDEGDLGSLDTENARTLFVRKLLSMGELFERVVLVTHITEVAEQFPSRIRVYMTPERYSRVEVGGAA